MTNPQAPGGPSAPAPAGGPAPRTAPIHDYATATQSLRTAAQWLLTTAAAVGGLLVAGLQLTNLGSLGGNQWPRLVGACVAIAAALTAVGYAALRTSALLVDEWITLAQLQTDDFKRSLQQEPPKGRGSRRARRRWAIMTDIADGLVVNKDELYGDVADDVSELNAKLLDADDAARADPSKRGDVEPLRSAANTVVQYANFRRTRLEFDGLRKRLAWASAVVVVSVTSYAYAANPPKKPQPTVTVVGVPGGAAGSTVGSRSLPPTASSKASASRTP